MTANRAIVCGIVDTSGSPVIRCPDMGKPANRRARRKQAREIRLGQRVTPEMRDDYVRAKLVAAQAHKCLEQVAHYLQRMMEAPRSEDISDEREKWYWVGKKHHNDMISNMVEGVRHSLHMVATYGRVELQDTLREHLVEVERRMRESVEKTKGQEKVAPEVLPEGVA